MLPSSMEIRPFLEPRGATSNDPIVYERNDPINSSFSNWTYPLLEEEYCSYNQESGTQAS